MAYILHDTKYQMRFHKKIEKQNQTYFLVLMFQVHKM
jgi:hypothetical protein